jgi:hypothetical protein
MIEEKTKNRLMVFLLGLILGHKGIPVLMHVIYIIAIIVLAIMCKH